MIDLARWQQDVGFDERPWLLVGMGPTFGRRGEFDLAGFRRIGVGAVVRAAAVAF